MSQPVPLVRLPLAFAWLALAGCASINPYRAAPAAAHADAHVTVQNPQWDDLTVYMERDGGRMRLGVVPGNATKTLVIPDALVSPNSVLRLVALSTGRELQGSSSYFDAEPGCRAYWSVGITGLTTPVTMVPPGD